MNKPVIRRIMCIDLIVALIAFDQWSKWFITERYFRPRSFEADGPSLDFFKWLVLRPQERLPFHRTEITSFFDLVMVWNKGVSFGMFSGDHEFMPYVLMFFALLLSGVFVLWLWRATSWLAAISLSMIIAGAVSNVWDRVRFRAVVDFLDFHLNDLHWPAFNIADSAIVIGVAGLAFYTLFLEPKLNKAQNTQ